MKTILTLADFKSMFDGALAAIKAREAEFSQLDAVLGDGDHGQAIVTAMSVVVEKAQTGAGFKSMLGDMGMEVLMQVSGSTSTLLGALLLGMSDGVAECDEIDAAGVKKMFASALKNVQMQTKAKPGDKTMMDALIPATEAIQAWEGDMDGLFEAAAKAAEAGAENSKNFVSKFGRAKSYGTQTIGTPDAGAVSMKYFFVGLAKK